jgi:imidazole glycerol-phosphate synthase subunit HisH
VTSPIVTIIETGIANTASVAAALRRCGVSVVLTDKPRDVERAAMVVLPGVGAFGAGMERLRSTGLDAPIIERINAGRPTLAICLGLQLLCDASEESPGVRGLGVVPGVITRFGESVRVPQFGWNRVIPLTSAAGSRRDRQSRDNAANAVAPLIEPGYAYFANSFRLVEPPPGWTASFSEHGGSFIAAMERGQVVACQFHPELSGAWGLALLQRWIASAAQPSISTNASREVTSC